MNKGKKKQTLKTSKLVAKEIRSAPSPTPVSEEGEGGWKILSKFPPLKASKVASEVEGSASRLRAKKKKLHSRHSRRASPGDVEIDAPPYTHTHPDGKKVIRNLNNQAAIKNKRKSRIK